LKEWEFTVCREIFLYGPRYVVSGGYIMNNKKMVLFLLVTVALISMPLISVFQKQTYDNIEESPLFLIRTNQFNGDRENIMREFEGTNESSLPTLQRPKQAVIDVLPPPTGCPGECLTTWP
jgi:hypothetical protein